MWRGWLAHWSLLECCKCTWVIYIVVGSIKEKERKLRDLITWSLAFQITASITYWLKQVIQTQDERRHIQELSGPVGCHLWKWYTTDHFLFTASHSLPHAKHKLLHSSKCSRTHGVKGSLPGPACELLLLWKHMGLKNCSYALMTLQDAVSRQGWGDHGHLCSKGKEGTPAITLQWDQIQHTT